MKFNIEEKLETTVQTLRNWKCVKLVLPIPTTYLEVNGHQKNLPSSLEGFKKFTSPYILYKEQKYYWFHAKFHVDELKEHQKVYLSIETFINGVASTIRPQGLLYLNGELVQGIDINHTDVLLKQSGDYEMYLLFYTHIFGFSIPLYFSLKYVDERSESLYYDFATILDSLKMLKKDDPNYLDALPILDEAMNLIDFREQNSSLFFDSIEKCREFLYKHFFNEYCGKIDRYINCIGHSHIDVAWMWDVDQTRQKVQRTFSTVLKLMDEYPEYRYFHSTPQVFSFLKEDNPTLFNKIKEQVKNKRFELDGAMWLEADCNLTSGESLVRQLVYGQEFFKSEFDVECKTLFLPDVFGYSSQLPQLLKKSGINRFVTAKIGWNDTNRFPYDSFNWIGLDGSSVFTFLISTCETDPRSGIFDRTYTDYVGKMTASQLLGTWNRYQNKDINHLTLTTYGWGDGGGGPTREMLEQEKRFRYGLPGLGKTRLASLNETLDEIERNCYKHQDKLPSWNGELYFEYHRGTYTSVPRVKFENRYCENLLQSAEMISSLSASLIGETYPQEELKSLWKVLLLEQFHDVLPGSSIEKVYLDADQSFNMIKEKAGQIIKNNLDLIAKNINVDKEYVIYNPTPVKGIMETKINGLTYYVKDVPALGYKTFDIETKTNNFVSREHYLENEYFVIKFDKLGNIISLVDKKQNKEYVEKGQKFNELVTYEDMPFQYDNWELTPYHKEKKYSFLDEATFTPISDGERFGFKIKRPYFNSVVTQRVMLNNYIAKIDFITNIDWKEKRQVLKVLFPTTLDAKKAYFETQFGYNERASIPQNSYDEAKFESCGQRWVDIFDNQSGLGLINNGKYGFSADHNVLSMTLLKSGSFPFDGASDIVPEFTYSLIPHQGSIKDSEIIEQAYMLNRPSFVAKISKKQSSLNDEFSLVKYREKGVYIDTVKRANDSEDIIFRLYETYNEKHQLSLEFLLPVKSVSLVNLKEEMISKIDVKDNKINLTVSPFEIVTLKVQYK